MDNRFGTWLRPALADFDEDHLKKRWAAVEALSTELSHKEIRELIRLSAKMDDIDQSVISKLRDSFFEHDNTFPMTDNDVELRLLSSVIVIISLLNKGEDRLDYALIIACLDFCGAHSCFELQALVDEANNSLGELSREMRSITPLSKLQKRAISAVAIMKPFKAKIEANQPQVLITDLEPMLNEFAKSFNQLAVDNSVLRNALELEKEEINILWWLVGSYSNELEIPYSELTKAAAAVVAGKEFAELVSHRPGPIGASGILCRMLANGSGKLTKISLGNLVTSLPMEWRKRVFKGVSEVSELFCPLLSAIKASVELDDSDGWIKLIEKKFPHLLKAAISPEIFGLQMYREWMLVLEIETWE